MQQAGIAQAAGTGKGRHADAVETMLGEGCLGGLDQPGAGVLATFATGLDRGLDGVGEGGAVCHRPI